MISFGQARIDDHVKSFTPLFSANYVKIGELGCAHRYMSELCVILVF